jgi:hypothetical protein
MPESLGGVASGAASGAAMGSAAGPWGALAGGVIGAGGALLSGAAGVNGQQLAVQDVSKGLAGYQGIDPNVSYQDVQGINGSALNSADQTGNGALKDALSQLQAKYAAGGLTANDINEMTSLQQAQSSEASAQRAAVQQQAQARGQSNSNLNYISQLIGGQQAASQAMQATQAQAAQAESQKMAALQGAAAVGGTLQQNAYQVANANDAINQFNKNIQVSNSENTAAAQQHSVGNQLQQAGGLAGVYGNMANAQSGLASTTQKAIANGATSLSGIPQLIGGAATSGGGSSSQNTGSNWNGYGFVNNNGDNPSGP